MSAKSLESKKAVAMGVLAVFDGVEDEVHDVEVEKKLVVNVDADDAREVGSQRHQSSSRRWS